MIFTIYISTYNRLRDIKYSIACLKPFFNRSDVEILICDDASTDGTYEFISENFPEIILFRNKYHKGYIHNRNFLLRQAKGKYAISLDDDLNFISDNVLETIKQYFEENHMCAVQGFRIYWGKDEPKSTESLHRPMRVKGYVGCAHAFRMSAWKEIPEYPEWFIFYGEENYASYQFFKKGWEIHYVPSVLGHHRVDMKNRKSQSIDFIKRQRRSIRAGWYIFFLFFPFKYAFRNWGSSIYGLLTNHIFKGNFRVGVAMTLALIDLLWQLPRIISSKNRLTKTEYWEYQKLPATQIYWSAE